MRDLQVTPKQLNDMKHAIGFDRIHVKRGKYVAYRNYYCADKEMQEWENLVDNGLATKQKRGEYIYYFVTDEGIKLLAELLEVKIVEER